MTPSSRDRISVDLRGLRAALFEQARARGISPSDLVRAALATAIDQAGPEKAQLFLVKLALLNANALADDKLFQQQITAALQDL
jgi:hypothetical protein